jgi:hypothetical protein
MTVPETIIPERTTIRDLYDNGLFGQISNSIIVNIRFLKAPLSQVIGFLSSLSGK